MNVNMARAIAIVAASLASSLVGCASYTRGKIDLVDQARHGVALVRQAEIERRAALDALAARQRAQLDAAFDADARAHAGTIDDAWVVAARKAYGVGVDALRQQSAQFDAGDAATRSNLDSVDAVLVQLQRMHAAELQLSLPEVTR